MAFVCGPCDKFFGNQKGLQQHLEDSPSHYQYTCESCRYSFKTQDRLEQHMRDAPRHKDNQYCEVCDRYFNRVDSLQAHLRDSDAHKTPVVKVKAQTKTNVNKTSEAAAKKSVDKTPLDRFFLSFPTFSYAPSLSPATSYQLLRKYTIKTKKYFPRSAVKNEQGEKNIVLRYLLRKIFMGSAGRSKPPAVMIAA
jgi:hypothetical protein